VIRPVRAPKPGALGLPDPDCDIVIVDADGNECPRAEVDEHGRLLNADAAIGEIVRRDPRLVFEGYYNNDDATAARSRNGWYWSGDLGYRDQDGIFYFAGRTADWLRVDGENFAAGPIERILARHPDVAGVAVYAVPDPVTGDQVMAALELRRGRTFLPDAFARFLDEQADLGTKWAPKFVRIVASLPVTGADKVDKKPLRAVAWVCDAVWWRSSRELEYVTFTESDADVLRTEFRAHGRGHLLP
jgi:fatty-acyl-CoA synthase